MSKSSLRFGWKLPAALAAAIGAALYYFFLWPGSSSPPPVAPGPPPGPPWFADVTDEVGLHFVHDAGPLPKGDRYFMPQIIGSGCALFDFNGDGLLDIYLLQNGGPKGARNRLYQQLPNGRFKDVSAGSGLDIAGYNMGVAVGDVNNDGLPDVLVTQYGGVKLFLNQGDGTFKNVTEEAGLKNTGWGCSAAFLDYDLDGRLDLVVVNYVAYDRNKVCPAHDKKPDYCGPNEFSGRAARLFHNCGPVPGASGKSVRFEDVTKKSGLGALPGRGLGVACADFDGDGWPDILVANDGQPNRLWINRHNGTFRDEAARRGIAVNRMGVAEANMGIALGDLDGDGPFGGLRTRGKGRRFDVLITHMTDETHTLWRQEARGHFQDETVRAGLARPRWRGTGFGTVLGDFDQDGALDLVVVNGRVLRLPQGANEALGPHWSRYAERNQLLANDGAWGFRDISPENPALCGTPNVARGLACGVFQKGGGLDLLVTTVAGRARLYRNVVPDRGHWLLVRAVDPEHGGRDAYGAEVRVRAGGRTWLRLINPGSSFLSSNDVRAHVGLGSARRVSSIQVRWPDGSVETFPGGKADRQVVLAKGSTKRGKKPR
jgi:hypothetical protein